MLVAERTIASFCLILLPLASVHVRVVSVTFAFQPSSPHHQNNGVSVSSLSSHLISRRSKTKHTLVSPPETISYAITSSSTTTILAAASASAHDDEMLVAIVDDEDGHDDHDHNNDDDDGNYRINDYSKIRKGEIYIQHDFLTPAQVNALRRDMEQLQQHGIHIHGIQAKERTSSTTRTKATFQPSGLSNRVLGDENIFGLSDRMCCTITPDLFRGNEEFSHMRSVVEDKMEQLKVDLEQALAPVSSALSLPLSLPLDVNKDGNGDDCFGRESELESKSKSKLKLELAEMYYSISPTGSHLPRHQDERHEDTKGEKGWMNETRRSISWLIYLNHDGWGGVDGASTRTCTSSSVDADSDAGANAGADADAGSLSNNENVGGGVGVSVSSGSGSGGELRAYCRPCCHDKHVHCGSHEGDIQVGWLRTTRTLSAASSLLSHSSTTAQSAVKSESGSEFEFEFEPVFLDSWVKMPAPKAEYGEEDEEKVEAHDMLQWQPMSALYRIRRHRHRQGETTMRKFKSLYENAETPNRNREYLSMPFGPQSPSWPSENNLDPEDFSKALALQLISDNHRRRFVGVEDIHVMNDPSSSMMNVVDVVPTGGTLVLFDSVTVPHEVLEVTSGTRMAIAGWFHEAQQDFPDWYGT